MDHITLSETYARIKDNSLIRKGSCRVDPEQVEKVKPAESGYADLVFKDGNMLTINSSDAYRFNRLDE